MSHDTSLENEEWRDIPGYEGHYEVSDHGNVRSVDRVIITRGGQSRKLKGKIFSPWLNNNGYMVVSLGGPSKNRRQVHNLVLESHLGMRPDGFYGCHNDGNALNNHLSNLRWDTPRENSLDKVRHGTCHESAKTQCPRGHELWGSNLAPWGIRQGCRTCLACARAKSYARKYGLMDRFEEIADDRYAKIMGEAKLAA